MRCILKKAHTFIGNIEKDHSGTKHTAGADDLHIKDVCNSDQQEDEYLSADAFKAHLTGESFVCNRTHDAGDVVDHHKCEQCVKQTVTATEKVAKLSSDSCKCKLDRVPEFLHNVCPPLNFGYEKSTSS